MGHVKKTGLRNAFSPRIVHGGYVLVYGCIHRVEVYLDCVHRKEKEKSTAYINVDLRVKSSVLKQNVRAVYCTIIRG